MSSDIPSHLDPCFEAFRRLLRLLDHKRFLDFDIADVGYWRDELGRLRIWSANIGAHRRGRASLDYRLRDDTRLRQQIIDLLDGLYKNLYQVENLINQKDTTKDEARLQGFEDEDQGDESEVEMLYDFVSQTIRRLFRMSMIVRKPPQGDFLRRGDIDKAMRSFNFEVDRIRTKYPNARERLVQRLAYGMVQRRNYLDYRSRHHAKLSEGLGDDLTDVEHDAMSDTNATTSEPDNPPLEITIDRPQFSDTSFAFSFLKGTHPNFPKRPRSAAAGAAFECPFCYYVITAPNARSWVKHVFSDLRPYMCYVDSCPTEHELYDSWHEWMWHLKKIHPTSSKDRCPFCTSNRLSWKEREWGKHVGKHLQDLAVFVLRPLDHDTADSGDSSSDSDGDDSSDPDDIDLEEKSTKSMSINIQPAQAAPTGETLRWSPPPRNILNMTRNGLHLLMKRYGTDWVKLAHEGDVSPAWVRNYYKNEIRKGWYGASLECIAETANRRLRSKWAEFEEALYAFPCLSPRCTMDFNKLSKLQDHMNRYHLYGRHPELGTMNVDNGRFESNDPDKPPEGWGRSLPDDYVERRLMEDSMIRPETPTRPPPRRPIPPQERPPPPPPRPKKPALSQLEFQQPAAKQDLSASEASARAQILQSYQLGPYSPKAFGYQKPHIWPPRIDSPSMNHSETVDAIQQRVKVFYEPRARYFMANPPADLKERYDEYKYLHEDTLGRLVKKLEALQEWEDEEVEPLRLQMIKNIEALRAELDEVGTKKEAEPAKEEDQDLGAIEEKTVDARIEKAVNALIAAGYTEEQARKITA